MIRIMHDAGAGWPYDIRDDIGKIVDKVSPRNSYP